MTIDATKPEDSALVSELPGYIRANRTEMNSMSSVTGSLGAGSIALAAQVTAAVGTEFSLDGLEVCRMTSVGASVLTAITDGIEGQIKILLFEDLLVTLTDSITQLNGTFDLNQAPAGTDYTPAVGDIIMLVNINGDGIGNNGYWKEINRISNV